MRHGVKEETAAAVTAAGGQGIGVVCDHRDDAAVPAAAGRIADAHGRLDLLVNNAWGGYQRLNAGAWEEWNAPLWQQPVELFDAMFAGWVRTEGVLQFAGQLDLAGSQSPEGVGRVSP
jgi:NAD(P)-dependent dehydrogenase (short-subunit alcohol dehydrogenase family)